MNRHELITYLTNRCRVACDFVKELDSAGFDQFFQLRQLNTAGNFTAAANVLLNLNKC